MNGLSWILYFADVSASLRWFLTAGAIIGAVGVVVGIIAFFISLDDSMGESDQKSAGGFSGRMLKSFLPFGVCAFVVASLLPSQNTLMLIAASEVGETILTSDTAQKVGGEAGEIAVDSLKLLRKYLDEQLGGTAPKS